MKKFVFALIFLILFSSSAFAKTVPGDVLVIFKNPSENKISTASLASDGEHMGYLASVASEFDAKVAMTYDTLSENNNEIFALIHSDTKTEQELLKEILARPDVKGASLNHISYPTSNKPNDTLYDLQWGMKAISADKVWDKTTGSSDVYVAVIDSGIEKTHEDLAANIATEYCRDYDASGNTISDYTDVSTFDHGTHVSGIIGAVGNNNKGVTGVNWTAKIIMFMAYTDGAEGFGFYDSIVVAALNDVLKLKQANVNIAAVNMSLAGWENNVPSEVSNSSTPCWNALKAVSDAGIVICVGASNEGQAVGVPAPVDDPGNSKTYYKGNYVYPASYLNIPNKIVVAAASQDVNGKIIRSTEGYDEANSNYSSKYVHVAAPGSHIVSTVPMDYKIPANESVDVAGYASWPGTSMATPYVAGSVALLKSAYPNATARQIKRAIFKGANGNYCKNDSDDVIYEDPKNHTKDNTSKYGFLDVKGAYDVLPEIVREMETMAAEAAIKPLNKDYTVDTEIDYEASTSKVLALNVGENYYGETLEAGEKVYIWLTSKLAADDYYYVTYVKNTGQLDIDVNNLYESGGTTKAYINEGTYTVSYSSEDGTIVGGYDTPVKLSATSKTSNNKNNNVSSSGGGCISVRSEGLGVRNVLIFMLISLGLALAMLKTKK